MSPPASHSGPKGAGTGERNDADDETWGFPMNDRPSRLHLETTREAGLWTLSPVSVLAGVVSAYGVFAIVAAIAGAVLTSIDVNTEFRTNDWTGSGAVAALTSALVLFLAYLFGGYVAGRMARRAGTLHGVMVFVVSLVIGAVAGGVVSTLADSNDVERNLRSIGMPTTTDQITDVALAGIIVSLAAVLVGAVLGGHLGERWHTKLARRVADPEIGTTAEERARLDEEQAERRDRIARDDAFDRDLRDQDLDRRDSVDLREDDEVRYTEAEWQARESADPEVDVRR